MTSKKYYLIATTYDPYGFVFALHGPGVQDTQYFAHWHVNCNLEAQKQKG
jgi:hypothetical protein